MAQLSLGIIEQSVGLRNLWLLEVLFSWYLNLVVPAFKKKRKKVNLRPVAMGRVGGSTPPALPHLLRMRGLRLSLLLVLLAAASTFDKHIRSPRGDKLKSALYCVGGDGPRLQWRQVFKVSRFAKTPVFCE